jgi:hypothetical protein
MGLLQGYQHLRASKELTASVAVVVRITSVDPAVPPTPR